MSDTGERHFPALLELTLSRFREFYREPGTVFWAFGFPMLLALGLGLAFRERSVPLARVGAEPGDREAVEFVEQLLSAGLVESELLGADEIGAALTSGRLDLVLQSGAEGLVYRFDPERAEGRGARLAVDDALQRLAGRADAFATSDVGMQSRTRYIDFLFPGILGMTLMSSCVWGVGYTLVLARKRRLLKRLAATPMRRTDFLLGVFLSRLLFLGLEVLMFLGFGYLVFDIALRGSVLTVGVVAFAGAAAFSALALVVAARVASVEAANGWLNLITLPMWMLSGIFFSYERFPEALHAPIRLLPLTALNDGLRAVINDGAGFVGVAPELLVMSVWAVGGFLVARWRFVWQ